MITNTKKNFITFLIGFSQIYAWATTYYLPAAIGRIAASDMGLSYFYVIGGFSWALLIGGLAAPKIGSWIDTEGGRRPLCVGSLLMGTGLIILSQAHDLFTWYFSWTILGLGMALGLFNAAFAAVGRLLGQESKKIIVRITLISGFATLFWPIATQLIEWYGWRLTVLIFSVPHLLIWAPLFFLGMPKNVPDEYNEPVSDLLVAPEKVKLIFYLLAIYATLRAIIGTVISVNILSMFEGMGIAVGASAVIASLIGPSQILGRILEMYFGKKFNPLHSSVFWTAVLPLAIIILLMVGPPSASLFSIAYGMSNGVLTITMSILPMILFGSKGYAKMLGKIALPVLLAQAAAPLLAAPIIERWSTMNVFVLFGALSVVALICILFLSVIAKRKVVKNALHMNTQ